MDLERGPCSGGTLLLVDADTIIGKSYYQVHGHLGVCEYPVKSGGTKFVFSFHFHSNGSGPESLAAKEIIFDANGQSVVTSTDFNPTERYVPKKEYKSISPRIHLLVLIAAGGFELQVFCFGFRK
ncbi:MAG: hypothetical protein ACYTFM_00315 [Planctomycetota bacterium]|jgi:hypothetical protein